jgi:hypothetical protein
MSAFIQAKFVIDLKTHVHSPLGDVLIFELLSEQRNSFLDLITPKSVDSDLAPLRKFT